MTVVALGLGYAQWRRQQLVRELDALAKDGASFHFEDHWLWPRAPSRAHVEYRMIPGERLLIGARVLDAASARSHFAELRRRLNELDVRETTPVIEVPLGFGTTFDEIPNLAQ
jgi:hypothetical protein